MRVTSGALDLADLSEEIEEVVRAALPADASFHLAVHGDCILIPPGTEIWVAPVPVFGRRTLRGEDVLAIDGALQRFAEARSDCVLLRFIDEMYFLDWSRFSPASWAELSRVYASLPGWIGATDLPRWFSSDERGVHLSASVEPPGLQVSGLIERERFEPWSRTFMTASSGLPFRTE